MLARVTLANNFRFQLPLILIVFYRLALLALIALLSISVTQVITTQNNV